jgi:inosine-uridine nucleoside N-ribohydrolase
VVLLVLVLTACSDAGSAETTLSGPVVSAPTTSTPGITTTLGSADIRTPIVIDTDMAAEGIMSILYLLEQEGLNILAITVSGTGLVHCDAGVEQVLGLLNLVEADPVPVACGPENPLEGFNAFPTSWRVGADEAYGLELPPGNEASSMSAPELLALAISESSRPVVIYADGPQTNLASALRLDPDISQNVERAFVMGGAIDVAGNTTRNPDAEWNIWVDPVAASEVFRSGIPVTLVPLDATNQVPLNTFHLTALEEHQSTPGGEAVVAMLQENDQVAAGGLYFWDQLTAALLVDETLATGSARTIEVVLDQDRTAAGVTVDSAAGSEMTVIDSVDTGRFETHFLSAIAGEDVGPIMIDADWTGSHDGTEWTVDLPGSLHMGRYSVQIENTGDRDAGLVVGYLTDGATVQDIVDWESREQPPFYEVTGVVFVAQGSSTVSLVEIDVPATYVLVGFEDSDDLPDILASYEVTE